MNAVQMIVKGYRNGQSFDLVVEPILQAGETFWLAPPARAAYERMKAAAWAAGVSLHINTAFRDYSTQKRLYDRYLRQKKDWDELPPSERGPRPLRPSQPGYSNHQQGIAVDLQTDGQRWPWLAAHSESFGFFRTVDHERWHHEYRVRLALVEDEPTKPDGIPV